MPNRASTSATESVANIAKVSHMKEIDAACEFDRDQRVLTPGEAVLLIVEATALRNRRIPYTKSEGSTNR